MFNMAFSETHFGSRPQSVAATLPIHLEPEARFSGAIGGS
jgi:hypothetical protein